MKKLISVLLTLVLASALLVFPTSAGTTGAITPDTSWYSEEATEFVLYNAADFLGIAELSDRGKTFEGKTIKLAADIDLNPGWTATVTKGAVKLRLPDAPTNIWYSLTTFNGTLDGQGHTVKGIYYDTTFGSGSVGFINELNGGTIKNLIIKNSLGIGRLQGSWKRFGGLVGDLKGTNPLIENVYVEMEVVHASDGQSKAGGIAGATEGATDAKFNNVVFAGNVYGANADMTAPNTSTLQVSQFVGDNGSVFTTENCAMIGTLNATSMNKVAGVEADNVLYDASLSTPKQTHKNFVTEKITVTTADYTAKILGYDETSAATGLAGMKDTGTLIPATVNAFLTNPPKDEKDPDAPEETTESSTTTEEPKENEPKQEEKTTTEAPATTEEPKTEKSGCGSAIGGSALVLVAMLGGAFVTRKKHND